ncbi:MAG TPA: tyrosine-type recombinase/integrase [Terriglobales bacterium]|nr:tyrosine-type recombinase/integrase [Terriglobales bacterium]
MLRHTFAVNCLNQGVPINIVKELLGHSSILTTMTYLRVVPIDLRVFLSRVEF